MNGNVSYKSVSSSILNIERVSLAAILCCEIKCIACLFITLQYLYYVFLFIFFYNLMINYCMKLKHYYLNNILFLTNILSILLFKLKGETNNGLRCYICVHRHLQENETASTCYSELANANN
jgi:hypothetical protein